MSIRHTARVTVNEPSDEIDLDPWLFGLSGADYQGCARGHRGAGVFADEQGRGMINVESIGGNLIVQHYRSVRADSSSVEMYSRSSRVYHFHLVPVVAAAFLARLSFLGHFLGRHGDEEALDSPPA